jgi:hypothetical protein
MSTLTIALAPKPYSWHAREIYGGTRSFGQQGITFLVVAKETELHSTYFAVISE